MLDRSHDELRANGVTELPEMVNADAGYGHIAQIQAITDQSIEVLIRPDGNMREANALDGRTASTSRSQSRVTVLAVGQTLLSSPRVRAMCRVRALIASSSSSMW